MDSGVPFPQALSDHAHWLASFANDENGMPKYTVVIVTCGDWDIGTCLPKQLELVGMSPSALPTVYNRWINIKRTFAQLPPYKKGRGMTEMLAKEGLPLVGHHHSGIDDSRNICNLIKHLIQVGAEPASDVVSR